MEQQVFRARHEPDLTEKRRESIVRRLRNAIGRVTPNGATFKAWKNIVAEAWTRVRRKAAAAFLIGALTFSVGACGTPSNGPVEPMQAQTVAGAPADPSATAKPSQPAESTEAVWTVKNITYSKDAVAKFGKEDLKAAGDFTVETMREYSLSEQMIEGTADGTHKAEHKAWLLKASENMTTSCAKDWASTVNTYMKAANPGQETAARDGVRSLSSYGLYQQENIPTDTPTVENQTVQSMALSPTADGRLSVKVQSSATLNFTNQGKPGRSDATRDQDFFLKQVDGHWKIDGWHGDSQHRLPMTY